MLRAKKILFIIIVSIVFIAGIFVGEFKKSMKYHVALAGCRKSQLTDEKYVIINLKNSPTKQMFQNYYSPNLDFVEYFVPENADAKTYLETFGYGGLHYFKTSDGEIYQCGFYK